MPTREPPRTPEAIQSSTGECPSTVSPQPLPKPKQECPATPPQEAETTAAPSSAASLQDVQSSLAETDALKAESDLEHETELPADWSAAEEEIAEETPVEAIDHIDSGVADDEEVPCQQCGTQNLRGIVHCGYCGKVQTSVPEPQEAERQTAETVQNLERHIGLKWKTQNEWSRRGGASRRKEEYGPRRQLALQYLKNMRKTGHDTLVDKFEDNSSIAVRQWRFRMEENGETQQTLAYLLLIGETDKDGEYWNISPGGSAQARSLGSKSLNKRAQAAPIAYPQLGCLRWEKLSALDHHCSTKGQQKGEQKGNKRQAERVPQPPPPPVKQQKPTDGAISEQDRERESRMVRFADEA